MPYRTASSRIPTIAAITTDRPASRQVGSERKTGVSCTPDRLRKSADGVRDELTETAEPHGADREPRDGAQMDYRLLKPVLHVIHILANQLFTA
jgi:hypothetical protein